MAVPTINFTPGSNEGASSGNETTTNVITPPNTNGDVIYTAMTSDAASQVFTYPAGFAKVINDVTYQSAATVSAAYKTASGEPSNFNVTLGTSERQVWISWSVSGDGGIHVIATENTGNSSTATCPAITTTVNDCLLFRVVATDVSAGTTLPHGSMTGWTLLTDEFQTSGGALSVYYKTLATAGTEASATVSLAVSEQWYANTFAIAPAVAPATERTRPIIRPVRSMNLPLPYLRI